MENNYPNNPQPKKRKFLVDFAIIFTLIAAFLVGYFLNYLINRQNENVPGEVGHIIKDFAFVVDPITGEQKELTEEDIIAATVNGLPDKYSRYYTAEEYQELLKENAGNRYGLGLSFYNNEPIVFKVYGNSPAHRAGIMQGDKVVAIQIEDLEEQPIKKIGELTEVLTALEEDQKITITFERKAKRIIVELQKEQFETAQVEYKDSEIGYYFASASGQPIKGIKDQTKADTNLDNKTAYIKLDSFESSAVSQLKEVLDLMKDRGRDKLILDLRTNGGGSLKALLDIASFFIYNNGEEESLVTLAEKKTHNEEYSTSENNFYSNLKEIFVLANEYTASASESLIGAMLYYGDCFSEDNLIIEKNAKGEATTYGKGVMQTTYTLESGGALKLTTGRLLFPDRQTCINEEGIKPAVENAVEKGEALERALELINGAQSAE